MAVDEQQEAVIEDVAKLKKELRSLKNKVNRIMADSEGVNLLGLQEQITALDKKVDSVNDGLLEVSAALADFEIDFVQYHMKSIIGNKLESPELDRANEYVVAEFSKSRESIKHSTNPLSVMRDFRHNCMELSKKYKLGAFRSGF